MIVLGGGGPYCPNGRPVTSLFSYGAAGVKVVDGCTGLRIVTACGFFLCVGRLSTGVNLT